ncbi:hypothetical protein MXD62_11075 [Frankia sp. Mgl5]|nr:hypothetical protein [Frankia sp. Mgl5]MCK9927705.1 hypothetical protein [Frankia sp. Mgl5]
MPARTLTPTTRPTCHPPLTVGTTSMANALVDFAAPQDLAAIMQAVRPRI